MANERPFAPARRSSGGGGRAVAKPERRGGQSAPAASGAVGRSRLAPRTASMCTEVSTGNPKPCSHSAIACASLLGSGLRRTNRHNSRWRMHACTSAMAVASTAGGGSEESRPWWWRRTRRRRRRSENGCRQRHDGVRTRCAAVAQGSLQGWQEGACGDGGQALWRQRRAGHAVARSRRRCALQGWPDRRCLHPDEAGARRQQAGAQDEREGPSGCSIAKRTGTLGEHSRVDPFTGPSMQRAGHRDRLSRFWLAPVEAAMRRPGATKIPVGGADASRVLGVRLRRSWPRQNASSPASRGRSRPTSVADCDSRCSRRAPTRRSSAAPCRRSSAGCPQRPC